VRLAIAGCTGRTGSAILRRAAHEPAFEIAAALTHAGDERVGADVGLLLGQAESQVLVRATEPDSSADIDALVEFTTPTGCEQWARWCGRHGVPLVSGTTNLGEQQEIALHAAAERVPVVWAPNMSIGVNLLLRLIRDAAATLGPEWDVEITETHHRHKVDAPSGTARALQKTVSAARRDAAPQVRHGRVGAAGPRQPGEIGLHARRMGENVGEHDVMFGCDTETLTLRHEAHSRETFAVGALRAAGWVVGKPPDLYSMQDVLAGT
jgi:4-hydroxy-tetrahydrodipicolinate reductase